MPRSVGTDLIRLFVFSSQDEPLEQLRHFRNRNLMLFLVHLGLFITVGLLSAEGRISGFYTTSTVQVVWNNTQVPLQPPPPPDEALDRCLAPVRRGNVSWGDSGPWDVEPRLQARWFLPGYVWVLFFVGVTAAAHGYRALAPDAFDVALLFGLPRYDRWLEYGLSAPAMLVVVAGLTGTGNVWALTLLAAGQGLVCALGYAIEALDYAHTQSYWLTERADAGRGGEGGQPPGAEYHGRAGNGGGGEDGVVRGVVLPVKGGGGEGYDDDDAAPSAPEMEGLGAGAYRALRINLPFGVQGGRAVVLRAKPGPALGQVAPTFYGKVGQMTEMEGGERPSLNAVVLLRRAVYLAKSRVFMAGFLFEGLLWVCVGFNLFYGLFGTFNCLNKDRVVNYTVIPLLVFAIEVALFGLFPAAQFYFHFFRPVGAKGDGFLLQYVYDLLSMQAKVSLTVLIIVQSTIRRAG